MKTGTVPQIYKVASFIRDYHPQFGRNYGFDGINCTILAQRLKTYDSLREENTIFHNHNVQFLRQSVAAFFRGWENQIDIDDYEGRFSHEEYLRRQQLLRKYIIETKRRTGGKVGNSRYWTYEESELAYLLATDQQKSGCIDYEMISQRINRTPGAIKEHLKKEYQLGSSSIENILIEDELVGKGTLKEIVQRLFDLKEIWGKEPNKRRVLSYLRQKHELTGLEALI